MADNLALQQVASSQNNKYLTMNDATQQLSSALSDYTTYDLNTLAANQTITTATFQMYMGYIVTTSTAGTYDTLTFPAVKRAIFYVDNQSATAINITVGTTTIVLGGTTGVFLSTDGTANGLVSIPIAAAAGTIAFINLTDVPTSYTGASRKIVRVNAAANALEFVTPGYIPAFFVPSKPAASQLVYKFKAAVPFTLPASLTGTQNDAGTAATGSSVFTLNKNGASIGTITFAASGTVGTYSFAADVAFAVGDILTVTAPATQDATLADICFSLLGYLT